LTHTVGAASVGVQGAQTPQSFGSLLKDDKLH